MNALASFAPILTLSIGSLGYLISGRALEGRRVTALFAMILIGVAAYLTLGLVPSTAALEHGLVINSFSRFFAFLACAGAFVSVVATSSHLDAEKIEMFKEYYFLLITSLCGALVMIFASDFLTLFIGLEVTSLALYCLCGARVSERASSESSLKYFLLGCVSSAFMLYGIALWYGATGSLLIAPASAAVASSTLMTISFIFMVIGLAFKLGLAPFHFWVPDVYQGAPTSVTTFMSCVVKVAAFGALLKVALSAFATPTPVTVGLLWLIAVIAMTVGNLAALQQRSVKRLLAYSSVAQAGYMLIGLVVLQKDPSALAATVFYLVSYCAMTIGAFSVLSAIGPDTDSVEDLKGLARRNPLLAGCMTLFFLALAGLPPSLAGLMGKVFLFSGALASGFYGLAVIAVLNSALACAYYFRVPVAMLFQAGSSTERISVGFFSGLAIAVCAVAVVALGAYPEPVMNGVNAAAQVLVKPS